MTPEAFDSGINKVAAFYPTVRRPDYKDVVYTKFSWVPNPVWERAVDYCLDGRESKEAPKIYEWRDYVRRANESFGYKGQAVATRCADCGGTGFVDAPFMVEEMYYPGVRPCQSCNRGAIDTSKPADQRWNGVVFLEHHSGCTEKHTQAHTDGLRSLFPDAHVDWTGDYDEIAHEVANQAWAGECKIGKASPLGPIISALVPTVAVSDEPEYFE